MIISFLDQDTNNNLIMQASRSKPSDNIYLNEESDKAMTELWSSASFKTTDNNYAIPSDLFFANTIPLLDCLITFDERKSNSGNKLAVAEFRVVVFDNYIELINNATDELIVVGLAILHLPITGGEIFCQIIVVKGNNTIYSSDKKGYRYMSEDERADLANDFVFANTFDKNIKSMMGTWYGIQIAMLHPLTKEIFRNPRLIKLAPRTHPQHRHNKVKYIKYHIINANEIESRLYGDNPDDSVQVKYKRHKLLWYCAGYHMPSKDNKFIQPHWKGPLRGLKSGDDRERVIPHV